MSFFKSKPVSTPSTPPVRTATFGAYRPLSDILQWESLYSTYSERKRKLPKYEMYLDQSEDNNVHPTQPD
jgi:hypothetical protein